MKRLSFLLLVLLLGLTLTGTAVAQSGDGSSADITWQAAYWDNVLLSGDPVLVRPEASVDHNWGFGSPAPTVPDNRFSARWEGTLNLPAGSYRFSTSVDDGVRLWVNDQRIIDSWQVQAETSYSGDIFLPGGPVSVRVEYFENTGRAVAELSWAPLSDVGSGWYGQYFNNANLNGAPALVRDVPAIDFNWGSGSPAADVIAPDTFSARWTRNIDVTGGQYEFTLSVDDGARLWVDGELLIDAWQPQAVTTYRREITLPNGRVPIRLEYFEEGGLAQVAVDWRRIHETPAPGPNLIVDNDSPGFVHGGSPTGWHTEPEGYGGSLRWTENNDRVRDEYNWARWYPDLAPGRYDVAVYVPFRFTTTSQARYWISHAGGLTLRVVDQSAHGGEWVPLGTFEFDGTRNDYISLADVTFEERLSRLIAWDAVRWTPVGGGAANAAANRAVVSPGQPVEVVGTNFPPGETVLLRLGPPATEPFGQYGQAEAGPDGRVSFTFTMPATWPNGERIESGRLVVLLITEEGTKATAEFDYVR